MKLARVLGAAALALAASMAAIALLPGSPPADADSSGDKVESRSAKCTICHRGRNRGLVSQWEQSKHAANEVECLDCHEADAKDPDAFQHKGETISIIVSPKDCAKCHADESKEFQASHHAKAGEIIGSLDNVLGEVVEGPAAAVNGCWQCHGSKVVVREDGSLDPATWPNTGMGRINPDGSRGSCTACHSRHSFDKALARRPENCGKCHMGPDHPQLEIYNESKHGIAYRGNIDAMNLESDEWVVGKDYYAAPTCATCHMSAAGDQKVSHDIGTRISWTLRPAVSKKLENWEERRGRMKEVCQSCHSPKYVDAFYVQFDSAVDLYNDKFGNPAKEIMDALRRKKKLSDTPFDEEIEWTYFFLWHHEGRRARHGAAMMGPDYTQWHGFYEVAHRFYREFIPEAEELADGDAELEAAIRKVMKTEYHRWTKGLSPEEREKIRKFYEDRYGDK